MDALQALYRDGVKLAEQEQAILKEEPNSVIPNLGILTALRAASESDTTRTAPVSSVPFKSRNPKRKLDDASINSTAEIQNQPSNPLSTSVATPGGPTHARLKGTGGRSTSVPSVVPKEAKEAPTLKTEEPLSASAIESVGTPRATGTEKSGVLKIGTEVAFRNTKHKGLDGEFIQCTILSVVGDGVKKRYVYLLGYGFHRPAERG
jgi:SAGA-associated factor 29